MPKKRSGGGLSPTQQAAKFLGVSVLAGAVLAGIALPAVGALGLAAKGSVESFDELPANMKTPPLSQRTTILDADGGQIATVYSRDRTVVALKDVSPYMQKAIVAIEDSRFYQHGAVDLKGVLRALNKNAQQRRGLPGRLDPDAAVREERLRRGGGRRPDEGRAGHPADHRPQDPRAEVRDPGRGGARARRRSSRTT